MNDLSIAGVQEIQKYIKFEEPSKILSGQNTLFEF